MKQDATLKAVDAGGRPCRLTIRLKNGQTLTREAQHAKGGPEVPMTAGELKGKFIECARQAINDGAALRALEFIERLDTLDNIRPLCQLLAG